MSDSFFKEFITYWDYQLTSFISISPKANNDIIIWCLGGISIGIMLMYRGYRLLKSMMLVENTPTSKIRSLAMGSVEICGKAMTVNDKIFQSPFSGRTCIWCRWTVEEWKNHGKRSSWEIIGTGELSPLIFLKDESGEVLVDLSGANIKIPVVFESVSGLFGNKFTERAVDFLNKNQIFAVGYKKLRIREYCIKKREMLYIMGTAGENPYRMDGNSTSNESDIMIQKGENVFYVNNKGEKEILKCHRYEIFNELACGIIIITIFLFILIKSLIVLQ